MKEIVESHECSKEAPIYFSNIFISFLGLAYFTPLGCQLNFFGQFSRTKRVSGSAKLPKNFEKNLNLSGQPKGVK